MENKFNVLVFPCGSEVGLEVYRSLQYSRHINLIGGSSVDDHGKFVFENYIGEVPFFTDYDFIYALKEIVIKFKIDAIYPTMDAVISVLKPLEGELTCKVIGSPSETTHICASKNRTYHELSGCINIPQQFKSIYDVANFPVFIKPDRGYGSRGAKVINSLEEGIAHLDTLEDFTIVEYLPGKEYTVDCFTNRNRELLFVGPRPRRRIRTGISVNSISIPKVERKEFELIAKQINEKLHLQGAWFFQLKCSGKGKLVLMEVASRLGGSSLLYRYKGVNFALLSVLDAFNIKVKILENELEIEIDRALDVQLKMNYEFDTVYVDFDDCLIVRDRINVRLVSKLYEFVNDYKKIILITRHSSDINLSLKKYRITELFDEIVHIPNREEGKSSYINGVRAIFIDDSFKEREEVKTIHGIPVFSPDMIC